MRFLCSSDPSAVFDVLREEGVPLPLQTIALEHQGMDNRTFVVDGEWIFRFPIDSDYGLSRELWVLKALEQRTTLPIPRVEWVGVRTASMGYRRLPGQMFGDRWLQIPRHQMEGLCEQVAQFFAEVHGALDPKQAAAHGLAGSESWARWLSRIEPFLARRVLPGAVVDYLGTLLPRAAALLSQPPIVVLHQDLHGQNLLVDELHRACGVIDFGDVGIGSAHIDFYSLCWEGFEPMVETARRYTRMTGVPIDVEAVKAIFALVNAAELGEHYDRGDPRMPSNIRRLIQMAGD